MNFEQKSLVSLKVLLLGLLPLLVVMSFFLFRFLEPRLCLFAPEKSRYVVEYKLISSYPENSDNNLSVEVGRSGYTTLILKNQVIWEGPIESNGVYFQLPTGDESALIATEESQFPFTLFWLPSPHGIPFLNQSEIRKLSNRTIIDLTGFFGEKNRLYFITVGDYLKDWRRTGRNLALREIMFLDSEHSMVGRAEYEPSSGLLIRAISYAEGGARLEIDVSDYSVGRFRSLMLLFVLITATVLIFLEIIVPAGQPDSSVAGGKRMSAGSEFCVLGYTVVLIDLYYDFLYFHYGGDALMVIVHLLAAGLIWYRLGWWALMPILEVLLAFYNLLVYGSFQPVFAYFPASFSAWFIALLVQGELSPGKLRSDKKGYQ